jgi:hypothetical protein
MQEALQLVRKNAWLRASDLADADVPRVVLAGMAAANWSVRRAGCTGFQTAAAPSMKLVTVASKVPRALVCLLSALQFHGLTTRLPWWVWIAMSRGSHVPRLEYPPIRMVQFTGEAYTKDIETREVACHRGARHGEQPARGLSRSKL